MFSVILIIIAFLLLFFLIRHFSIKRVCKLFEKGNVSVSGLRGTGKDMLTANVIARRKHAYISNVDYHIKDVPYIRLSLKKLDVPDNYDNFISNDIIPYDYPYPECCDIYLSDAGVVLPSQFFAKLEKNYPGLPVFQALSRHLGNCNFHVNSQALNRVWDKVREQSDLYIYCKSCKVLFGRIVLQSIMVYEKYQSAVDHVAPYRKVKVPLIGKAEAKAIARSHNEDMRIKYANEYGLVKKMTLIYRNRSAYDTRFFKSLMKTPADSDS